MNPHVLARLGGFGWIILPRAPFRLDQVPDRPTSVVVTHNAAQAIIDASAMPPGVELMEGTGALAEVADLLLGPPSDHWRIETSVFTLRWPAGFALWSSEKPPGFELVGPHDTMVFLQGPFPAEKLPPLDRMAGEGQTVLGHGSSPHGPWVDVGYEDNGTPWRHRHRIVPLDAYRMVITAQAPADRIDLADAAAQEAAVSLQPYVGSIL